MARPSTIHNSLLDASRARSNSSALIACAIAISAHGLLATAVAMTAADSSVHKLSRPVLLSEMVEVALEPELPPPLEPVEEPTPAPREIAKRGRRCAHQRRRPRLPQHRRRHKRRRC